ncbi:hypothetical protein ACHAXR_009333, partial [Thalassiosira sp. AJA248-18]
MEEEVWQQEWDQDYDKYYEHYGPYYNQHDEDYGYGDGGEVGEDAAEAAWLKDWEDDDGNYYDKYYHHDEDEEVDWVNDEELDQIIAALNMDRNTAPLYSLEEQIEIVLQQKFQQRQDQAGDNEMDDSISEKEAARPTALKGEASAKEDQRDLRKKKKKKKTSSSNNNNNNRPSQSSKPKNNGNKKKNNQQQKQKQNNNSSKPKQKQTNNNSKPKNNGNKIKNNNNNSSPNKRKPYSKNKHGNKYHTDQQNRKFRNVCLTDPPDKYRTCFARTIDPTNDVEGCDKITRNTYNLGAQLYKRGRPIPDGITKPYTEPYMKRGIESRTEGKMHISLFQVNKQVTCDDLIDIEETTLNFLEANVGNTDTFRPACAYVNENAIDTQIQRDANGKIMSAMALRVEVIYTTNENFKGILNEKHDEIRNKRMKQQASSAGGGLRKLQAASARCDSANHHLCCSQTSINADVGSYCGNLGCDFSSCGGRGLANQRPPGRPPASGGGGSGQQQRPPGGGG